MSRLVAIIMLCAAVAHADTAAVSNEAEPDPSDQIIGVSLGVAVGGRVTPGGLRISGHYHYQLSDHDWFDGRATFIFGGNSPECFRDRMDDVVCDHGLADGQAGELSANIRRFFGSGQYMPFVRAGLGVMLVRFGPDDVTGIAFPLHAGVGLRVLLTPAIALNAEAELEVGVGAFNRGLGAEPQVGSSIAAGAEFRL